MLPLYDTQPNRYSRFSIATLTLIVVNIVVYGWQLYYSAQHGAELYYVNVIYTFGFVPKALVARQGVGAIASLTSLFLHGSFAHILFNMWALWVFGRRVEDACGAGRFLLFYLCCGLIADLLTTAVDPTSPIPSIGASGAIFGVEGAYLLLYPSGRIRTLILWFIPMWPTIPAIWIILYQIPLQLMAAFQQLLYGTESRIGYWAHLGGFFGSIIIVFFLRPWVSGRFWRQETI